MKYCLYLTEHKQIREMYDEAKAALPVHSLGKGACVHGHQMSEGETGILYITVSDLSPDVSPGLAPLVTRVTAKETISRGFRRDGIYEQNGARLSLLIRVEGYSMDREEFQDIEISASSIEAARAIYEAVRTGKLQPTLDFEAGGRDDTRVSVPTADAAATRSE